VVHRDIKPGNVLMQEDGSTKVTDFGLARLTADKGWTITGSDAVAGTPLYMSPEAVAGAAPDQRMDLYSLGVVLYEMVQGQRPQGDFAALSGPLDRVVRRALAPDPGRRYQSAAEMASELRSLASAPERHDLDADQQVWVHAVAAVQALVTATFLWAFLASVTPKVLQPDEVMPLIMLGVEELDDGRILSRVRFETWWTLAAVAAAALGVAAYGLLRQHWRRELLLRSTPEQAIATSRKVLVVGAISCLVYAFRWLGSQWLPAAVMAFVPLLGAGILIAALFLSWVVVLSAVRTARPLRREVGFLLGAALAVAPAVVELVQFLLHWTVPEGS
jgi:serine/threonine-protein kinase